MVFTYIGALALGVSRLLKRKNDRLEAEQRKTKLVVIAAADGNPSDFVGVG